MKKEMTDFVVVLHELDDDPALGTVVLHGYDPHDVGGVLCVRVGAVFVGQHQARVSLMHLEHRNMQILIPVPVYTFALSRSTAFISDPWKYFILVCCLFSSPSSSKSGSALGQEKSYVIPLMQNEMLQCYLCRKTTSTSTSSLSSWRKSLRKCETDS